MAATLSTSRIETEDIDCEGVFVGKVCNRIFVKIRLAETTLKICFCTCPEFPTSSLEMETVAGIFDQNKDGFIDYYEFANALHPSRDFLRQSEDEDRIDDEVRDAIPFLGNL
ncbi:hypothetical protein scyTo_0027903 [Scyliorhinus torazame]|uniref:EF-hand domain-containing protein n=1 Tax=Scyliorhinus torazame TaxID=75743 RepID=A0A401QPF3_SCYTO|nr:hypothetical protein [Scyliorhinus torazame]